MDLSDSWVGAAHGVGRYVVGGVGERTCLHVRIVAQVVQYPQPEGRSTGGLPGYPSAQQAPVLHLATTGCADVGG